MRELALAQVALPLGMIVWLLLGRPPSRLDFLFRVMAAWLLLTGLWIAGVWLALPWRTAQLLAILLAVASLVGALRTASSGRGHSPAFQWGGRLAAALVGLVGLWLVAPALAGRSNPGSAVDLSFPFRSGRYIVANGGSTERVNAHLMTLDPRYRRWRGQSYGIDLIRVDEYGFRTRRRSLFAVPSDPEAYLSFGEEVSAPCSGIVVAAEEGRPDMPVPERDRRHLEGNFVLLRCSGLDVLLGHFRRRHIDVEAGQRVEAGQVLGQVGNSGNSDEPHLHIHVQDQGTAEASLAAAPLFATFDGRFLVRNMIISPASPD